LGPLLEIFSPSPASSATTSQTVYSDQAITQTPTNPIVDKLDGGVYPQGNNVDERRDFDTCGPRTLILATDILEAWAQSCIDSNIHDSSLQVQKLELCMGGLRIDRASASSLKYIPSEKYGKGWIGPVVT
jgi:hypothetical protein